MASSFIGALAEELLLTIFTAVKKDISDNDFTQVMLVSQQFKRVAEALLYSHVFLSEHNIELFVDRVPRSKSAFVKSLSVCLAPQWTEPRPRTRTRTPGPWAVGPRSLDMRTDPAVRRMLNALDGVNQEIKHMSRLVSLSLVCLDPRDGSPPWLPQHYIVSMLENIAGTCVSVEIDTARKDYVGDIGSAHLCESFRMILPQLEHLRVRMGNMCPLIFCNDFSYDAPSDRVTNCVPVYAPHLKSFILNTASHLNGIGSSLTDNIICCRISAFRQGNTPEAMSRSVMAQSLRAMVAHPKSLPSIRKLWYITLRYRFVSAIGLSFCSSYIRRDILANESWACPIDTFGRPNHDLFLIRVPQRQDILYCNKGDKKAPIDDVVEADAWVTATSGTRLPLPVMTERSDMLRVKVSGDEEAAACHPRSDPLCIMWINDRTVGDKFATPQLNDGVVDDVVHLTRAPEGYVVDGRGGLIRQ